MTTPPAALWQGEDLLLTVRVQPRAAREEVKGLHQGLPKVALRAPPVDNAANRALCLFMADQFKVAKGRVSVVSGQRARTKRLCIASPRRDHAAALCKAWGVSL